MWFEKLSEIARELGIPFVVSGLVDPTDGVERKYVNKAALGSDNWSGKGDTVEEACEGAFSAYMDAQREATENAVKNLKKLQRLAEKAKGKVLTFPSGAR